MKAGQSSHEIEKAAVIYLCLAEECGLQKKAIESMKAEIVVLTGPRRLEGYGHVVDMDK